jgi:geranylgeranyl pyrophosphate synthase
LERGAEHFRRVLTVIKQIELSNKIEFVNRVLEDVDLSNIHSILRCSTKYTILSGGQRLRPLICMLCAEVVGGKDQDAKDTFVALELIHNATLIHDDILDEDQFRRGMLSVPEKYGTKKAVLTGDTLFSLGLMYAAKTGKPKVVDQLSQTTLKMIQGIALQNNNKGRIMSENELLNLNYLKSGSLFEAAAVLGGMMGTEDTESLEKMAEFGRCFGNAYQIRDDICDAFLEQGADSKARNDILNGDPSLLFIYSLESENIHENEKKMLLSLYQGKSEKFDLQTIRKIFEKAQALDKSIKKMKSYALKGRKTLEFFKDSEAKSTLNKLMDRYYLEFDPADLHRDLV